MDEGLPISKAQWIDIQHSASKLVQEILLPHAQDVSDVPCCKRYFTKQWPRQWDEVIARLENQQPLLQLCAFHWKAEMVIVNVLDTFAAKLRSTMPEAQDAVTPPAPSQTTESTRPDSPPPSTASVILQSQSFMSPLKHLKHKITPMSPVVKLTKKRRVTITGTSMNFVLSLYIIAYLIRLQFVMPQPFWTLSYPQWMKLTFP